MLGLGNPGPSYRATRHNLGYWVVERLARRAEVELGPGDAADGTAVSARVVLGGCSVVLAKPRTFMNHAGRAAAELCRRHSISATELAVVHDDADLALGHLRLRRAGGAGGHNGVRSLIDELGHGDFVRVRLGVRGAGRDAADLADYVLAEFDQDELPVAARLANLAADAVETLVQEGLAAAMNRFNGDSATRGGA